MKDDRTSAPALLWAILLLLTATVPIAGSSAISPIVLQDQEWEYDYSVGDEEWYDVSDWLDTNNYDEGYANQWYESSYWEDEQYDYYDDDWEGNGDDFGN